MPSNHLPKNTTIPLPPGSSAGRAEIFWQTLNCEHFMDNYRTDTATGRLKEKVHNLKFSDVAKMLSGNVVITPVSKSSRKYQAFSYWNDAYYLTIFTLERRTESRLALFAVIITTHITYESQYISNYQQYLETIRQRYGR